MYLLIDLYLKAGYKPEERVSTVSVISKLSIILSNGCNVLKNFRISVELALQGIAFQELVVEFYCSHEKW